MSNYSILRNLGRQFDIILKNAKVDNIEKLKNPSASVGNIGNNSNETILKIGQEQDDDILFIPIDDNSDSINSLFDLEIPSSFLQAESANKETNILDRDGLLTEKPVKDKGVVYDYNESLANYSKDENININNLFEKITSGAKTDEEVFANNFVTQLKGSKSSLTNPDIFQDLNKYIGDKDFTQQLPQENEAFKSLSDSQKQKLVNFIMSTTNTSEVNAAKMLVELNEQDLKELIKQLGIQEYNTASSVE